MSDSRRGFRPEAHQLGVPGVVVVDLGLDARVGDVLNLDFAAFVLGGGLDEVGELCDRELLGELVEDAVFAGLGGFLDCDFDTSHRVADVQVAAGLAPLPCTVSGWPMAASMQNRLRTVPQMPS